MPAIDHKGPASPSGNRLSAEQLRTLAIASLGGMLEFYDFVVFVFFSRAIGQAFFPADAPEWVRHSQVFAIFAAGYLVRPAGGILMAHFGDLRGRKRVFTLSILMMALPTFAIGWMPTYADLGYLAPILLLCCRILQGAAVGGEVPGAWVFVAEHAPRARIGLACGILTAGLTSGIFFGSAANAVVTSAFGDVGVQRWAWRIPFLAGGALGLLGMALRTKLAETPVFEQMKRDAGLARGLPLRAAVHDHPRALLVSMLACWYLSAAIVVLVLLAPTLLSDASGLDASTVARASLVETGALTLGCVVWGAAIDRLGLRPVIWVAGLVVPPAALLLYGAPSALGGPTIVFAIAGAASGLISFVPVVMVRAFPPQVAFSGVSTSLNATYAIAGGLTPPLAAVVYRFAPVAPGVYVAAVCAVSAAAVLWMGSVTADPAEAAKIGDPV